MLNANKKRARCEKMGVGLVWVIQIEWNQFSVYRTLANTDSYINKYERIHSNFEKLIRYVYCHVWKQNNVNDSAWKSSSRNENKKYAILGISKSFEFILLNIWTFFLILFSFKHFETQTQKRLRCCSHNDLFHALFGCEGGRIGCLMCVQKGKIALHLALNQLFALRCWNNNMSMTNRMLQA